MTPEKLLNLFESLKFILPYTLILEKGYLYWNELTRKRRRRKKKKLVVGRKMRGRKLRPVTGRPVL